MKRSEIQGAIRWAIEFAKKQNFNLPKFAFWSKDEWAEHLAETESLRKTMLGWDVTDYGMGDFKKIGSILFTIRNGLLDDATVGTPYAEKIIVIPDGQRLPMHFHSSKTEDIINRGGGMMFMKLWNAAADDKPDKQSEVVVYMDGIKKTYQPGEEFLVEPGSSVSLTPRIYHIFGSKAGTGDVLCGEVSSINDDKTDNHFYEDVSRFAKIDEDEAHTYLLCNEYDLLNG